MTLWAGVNKTGSLPPRGRLDTDSSRFLNVSPLQLRNRGFVADIQRALDVDARASGGLELELTESLVMEDVRRSIATLHSIRSMGVSIAIDDFGAGFSSLGYLAKLPINTLKVDRSFIDDLWLAGVGFGVDHHRPGPLP
jgi:EAL domain-containing protein (putative c-di-GMP-specific phosphodiesterase class I)